MADVQRKVLIVDDDPAMLEELCRCVVSWCYTPVTASGPDEAMRMFNSDPEIQLIISDQGMVPLTGIGMITMLRSTQRRFEAIIFSGGNPYRLIDAATLVGVRKIVEKPDCRRLHEELVAAAIALDMNLP